MFQDDTRWHCARCGGRGGVHSPKCVSNPNPIQSESEKFFAHLNNGEVYLKLDVEHGNVQTIKGILVVIVPKEVGK